MAPPPSLCVIHGGVDDSSAINRIAKHTVIAALDAGWNVTVVAQHLETALSERVEWRHLFVPPRLHAVQWLSARAAVKHALEGSRFDVVIGWQAQLIGVLDIYNCQYLSEATRAHDGFAPMASARSSLLRAQQEVVTQLEARRFRHWDQRALMIYSSALIKREFEFRYPVPRRQVVIENFGPAPSTASAHERMAARQTFGLADARGPVLAFLGGFDERKGVRDLAHELRLWPEASLLLAGPDFGGRPSGLPSNVVLLGHVEDVRRVLAAADVTVVPSRFDPFAVVVLESAATGTPIIVTPEVGALDAVERFGGGLVWDRTEPLRIVAERILGRWDDFHAGALRLAAGLRDSVFRAAIIEQLERSAASQRRW